MKITQTANLHDLAERMGNQYTAADAKLFLQTLLENGLEGEDTSEIPDGQWLALLEAAGFVAE